MIKCIACNTNYELKDIERKDCKIRFMEQRIVFKCLQCGHLIHIEPPESEIIYQGNYEDK